MRNLLAVAFAMSSAAAAQTATAEAQRYLRVPPDEAVFDLRLIVPAKTTFAELLAANSRLGLREIDLYGATLTQEDQVAYQFQIVAPAAQFDQMQARLADVGVAASLRPSAAAIDRARAEMLPEAYAEARSRAEQLLRESGYQPGALAAIGERTEWNAYTQAAALSLTVRLQRQSPSSSAAFALTQIRSGVAAGAALTATFYFTTGPGISRAALVALLRKEGIAPFSTPGLTVSSGRSDQPAEWTYTYALPTTAAGVAFIAQAIQRIRAAQPSIFASVQMSPQFVESPGPALTAAARRHAEALAGIAGFAVGSLRAIRPAVAPVSSNRVGFFSVTIGRIPTNVLTPVGSPLEFEFALVAP